MCRGIWKRGIWFIEIAVLLVSFVLTFVILTWNRIYVTGRGEPEGTCLLTEDIVITQNVLLDHTTFMSTNVLVGLQQGEQNQDAVIVFTLQQESQKQEYLMPISRFLTDGWQDVNLKFDFSKYHAGEAILSVSAKNLENNTAEILLTGGEQYLDINFAKRNGETCENQYLTLSYNSYNLDGFCSVWFRVFIFSLAVFGAVLLLLRVYVSYPATATAILVMLLYMIRFNLFSDFDVDDWIKSIWMIDYRYGFVNRGFLGTVLTLVTKIIFGSSVISDHYLLNFLKVITLLAGLVTIRWIWKLEDRINQNYKKQIQTILLIWILSPWFYTFFLTNGSTFGRPDIILMVCFLISCELIMEQKRWWLIPVLSIIGVATYQMYTIIYFPTIFVLMLEVYSIHRDKNCFKSLILNTIGTIGFTFVVFLKGNLAGRISKDEYYLMIQSKYTGYLDQSMATAYPFGNPLGTSDIAVYHLYMRFALLLLFAVPILLFLEWIWFEMLKRADKVSEKIIIILFLISPLSIVFVMNGSDLVKYFTGIFTALVNGVLVSGKIWEEPVLESISNIDMGMEKRFGKQYMAIFLSVLFMLGVGYGSCWPYTEVTNIIIEWLSNFVATLRK